MENIEEFAFRHTIRELQIENQMLKDDIKQLRQLLNKQKVKTT